MSAYIIAEAGLEANGSTSAAAQLIFAASFSGADCVKFQLYSEETANKVGGRLPACRLDVVQFEYLRKYTAKCNGIEFLLSAFDMESLKQCKLLGCKAVKIPSVCNENWDMLQYADDHFDVIYVSSGLAGLIGVPAKCLTLLCTSVYPCPFEQVNLRAITNYDGLSDHTIGWEVPIAAVAMGAMIIEKHLTISRSTDGPDACCALEPMEFADMVYRIRNVEKAMGDGIKKIEPGEMGLLWRKQLGCTRLEDEEYAEWRKSL